MPPILTHPDLEELNAFGVGRLSEARALQIELHLDDCEACRQQLQDVPDDALIRLLQAPASETQTGPAMSSADTDASLLSSGPVPFGDARGAQPAFTVPKELAAHPRYVVLGALGAGGMGLVFKARHGLMERLVALKIVNPLLVNNPGAVERFRREVRASAQLVHPNIVAAYDAEAVGGTHFLVMEYVEGQTLAEVLAEQHTLPIHQACEYLRQTSLGLQHALQHGMVHRDIKPQNLMLSVVSSQSSVASNGTTTDNGPCTTDYGQIKILDFGLARFVSEASAEGTTEQGMLMGSPDYMAPEQERDAHAADTRADIYGMGCTLYHLLTGEIPFPAKSLLDKLEAHRDRQPRPLPQMRPDVPLELANVVAKMMAKDPAQRYQSPAEVALALCPFALPQPTFARPAQVPRPSRTNRQPGMILGAALLLAGIGIVAAIAFSRAGPHRDMLSPTAVTPNVKRTPPAEGSASQTASPPTRQALRGTPPLTAIAPFNALEAKAHQQAWADYLGTQVETTNSVGAKMILIPPGEFLMGSTDEQVEAALAMAEELGTQQRARDFIQKSERPQHRVVLSKPWLMGATEVTIGQFKRFTAATGYKTVREIEVSASKTDPPPTTIFTSNYRVTDDSPAAVITWSDAVAFCKWLSEQEDAVYRLPTEAEWEYACRAGSVTQFSFGDRHVELWKSAWYRPDPGVRLNPTGTKQPNGFGVFDMQGSVFEWCHDYWDEKAYEQTISTDPTGPPKPLPGSYHVIRGGSWYSSAPYCRSAYRSFPGSLHSDDIGFRYVREW